MSHNYLDCPASGRLRCRQLKDAVIKLKARPTLIRPLSTALMRVNYSVFGWRVKEFHWTGSYSVVEKENLTPLVQNRT